MGAISSGMFAPLSIGRPLSLRRLNVQTVAGLLFVVVIVVAVDVVLLLLLLVATMMSTAAAPMARRATAITEWEKRERIGG